MGHICRKFVIKTMDELYIFQLSFVIEGTTLKAYSLIIICHEGVPV